MEMCSAQQRQLQQHGDDDAGRSSGSPSPGGRLGYRASSCVAAVGGLLFGLDTGIIGPVTTMDSFERTVGHMSSTLHGLVVSSILISGTAASFFAGHLADAVGRTRAVMAGAFLFGVGTALEAGAGGLIMFIIGRILTGVGEGLFLSTVTVYICEISPPDKRGPLASLVQFLITLGICVGYFTCYGTVNIPSSLSWRLPFILQSFIAIVLALSCPFLPQSPYWLISVGRHNGISQACHRPGAQCGGSTAQPKLTPQQERDRRNAKVGWMDMFKAFRKPVYKRTALGVFIMGMQQLSGIDGVLYYAPVLFRQAGLSSKSSTFLASGISGLLMTIVTVPATLFADRWGRRTSIIYGGFAISSFMILIGALYASGSVRARATGMWVVIVSIYLFVISYCVSWAVCIRISASEIQPAATRAGASSLAQSANWGVNWLVAFTTPMFLSRSSCGPYFLFGFSSLVTVLVCFTFLPESRGLSLEGQVIPDTSPGGDVIKRITGRRLHRFRTNP